MTQVQLQEKLREPTARFNVEFRVRGCRLTFKRAHVLLGTVFSLMHSTLVEYVEAEPVREQELAQ